MNLLGVRQPGLLLASIRHPLRTSNICHSRQTLPKTLAPVTLLIGVKVASNISNENNQVCISGRVCPRGRLINSEVESDSILLSGGVDTLY